MRTRRFGPTGVEVPVIGQGTWKMERDDRDEAIRALRRGLDLGMTHIDTAEMYGDGRVEELVGEAIDGRRDEVFLVSKVLPSNASRRGTVEACDSSLQRLGTDRLDAYLLHWPGRYPLRETVAGFQELVEAGKILAWGVSNFDSSDLREALELAGGGPLAGESSLADGSRPADGSPLACDQVLYHLDERHVEQRLLSACRGSDVALVAYSPFGSGRFPGPGSPGGRVLSAVAEARDATPRQVALAFLVRHPEVFAIPKAARIEHVEENAGAGDLELSDEEIRRLDEAFPRSEPTGSLPVV